MFNTAWEYLKARGRLENTYLLNDLRVHRSSAVCAVLGRLPQIQAHRGRRIGRVGGDSRLAAFGEARFLR